MTGLRTRPWLPQPDEAARDYAARYAPGRDPGFLQALRDACEAMPRTARLLAIIAGLLALWPLILLVTP